jgi:MSHA biogenesis protein MshP
MKNQRGFTLVGVIFILVVLGILGAAMLTLSQVQTSTGIFALQGARAYVAAQSGIEWGINRALPPNNSCVSTSSLTIEGFRVTVGCTGLSVTEGASTYTVYTLTSVAEMGDYGGDEYFSRRVEARVTNAR